MRCSTMASMSSIATAVLVLVLSTSASFAQRVPCTEVLRKLSRVEGVGIRGADDSHQVAKSLGTTSSWVEKCASLYGRRLRSRPGSRSRREAEERYWEQNEPEEIAREDRETDGDVIVDPAPYRDKARQRGFSLSKNLDSFEDPEHLWSPYEHQPWSPNTGKRWSPYPIDRHRTIPDDVPGLLRD